MLFSLKMAGTRVTKAPHFYSRTLVVIILWGPTTHQKNGHDPPSPFFLIQPFQHAVYALGKADHHSLVGGIKPHFYLGFVIKSCPKYRNWKNNKWVSCICASCSKVNQASSLHMHIWASPGSSVLHEKWNLFFIRNFFKLWRLFLQSPKWSAERWFFFLHFYP